MTTARRLKYVRGVGETADFHDTGEAMNDDTFEWPDENDRDTTILDGRMPNGDNYTRLAWCMECHPNEVSRLIQQHAPWNGKAVCDDALRERAAVVAWLRGKGNDPTTFMSEAIALTCAASIIERGEHRKEEP